MSLSQQQHHLRFLEHALNEAKYVDTSTPVILIDIYTNLYLGQSNIALDLIRREFWDSVNGVWDARVRALVTNVMTVNDSDSVSSGTRLVETLFIQSSKIKGVLLLLARVKFDKVNGPRKLAVLLNGIA